MKINQIDKEYVNTEQQQQENKMQNTICTNYSEDTIKCKLNFSRFFKNTSLPPLQPQLCLITRDLSNIVSPRVLV